MRVCLISVEIFAWGKYGGFGRATRTIARELAQRGVEVSVAVPRVKGQPAQSELDGIPIYAFKAGRWPSAMELFRQIDADIYHSEEPSLGTYLAMRAMPGVAHAVTFRDTRDARDWRTELSMPSVSTVQVLSNWLYEDNWLVRRSVRDADALFTAAKFLIPKAQAKYRLSEPPTFLPTPVNIPARVVKAIEPTVCFISRWDRRKRPEIFFELARSFPGVHFIAAGKSRDADWDRHLRQRYSSLPNLEIVGFIDQFQSDQLHRILGQSWIMVNTAAREGLPNAFLEAAAHRCAILSAVDPDGFSSQFGYHAGQDDFARGMETLLSGDCWRPCGERGYAYVKEQFQSDLAIERHLAIYRQLLATR
jgi:glycosyltransferase involved in cell wall biosynthesis